MARKASKGGAALTHIDGNGEARMVDVSAKPATERTAVAEGRVVMSKATLELIVSGNAKKGDVLGTARIARDDQFERRLAHDDAAFGDSDAFGRRLGRDVDHPRFAFGIDVGEGAFGRLPRHVLARPGRARRVERARLQSRLAR